jgi:hypothetical protein
VSTAEAAAPVPRAIRLRAASGQPPLGAIFLGIGLGVAAVVKLLHLDGLPFYVCYFRAFTGWPCMTCGSTRALGALARLDLAGALAANPLAVVVGVTIGLWGLADLALAPSRRALSVEVSPALARALRVGVVLAVAANWIYLLPFRHRPL